MPVFEKFERRFCIIELTNGHVVLKGGKGRWKVVEFMYWSDGEDEISALDSCVFV